MSRIRFLIAGLGLIGLLAGCGLAGCGPTAQRMEQRVEPIRVAQSSTDEWIAGYRAKYGCIGVASVNYGLNGVYNAEDQIEFDAKAAYAKACGVPGQLTLVEGLRVVRRANSVTGEVIGIAFKPKVEPQRK